MQAKCDNGGASNANIQKKQPVSLEIAQLAQDLANKAQALSERVDDKLAPVMISAEPLNSGAVAKDVTEYPPLFSDLRDSLRRINAALDNIGYAMSRTEL